MLMPILPASTLLPTLYCSVSHVYDPSVYLYTIDVLFYTQMWEKIASKGSDQKTAPFHHGFLTNKEKRAAVRWEILRLNFVPSEEVCLRRSFPTWTLGQNLPNLRAFQISAERSKSAFQLPRLRSNVILLRVV